MVLLSESYLQNRKKHATELALTFGLAPKTFFRYASDSHVWFRSRYDPTECLNVLNSQGPQIQYMIECENDNK